MSPRETAATAASTRSFSVITCRTRLAQRRRQLIRRSQRHVPQARHAELRARPRTLGASLVVARGRVRVVLARVERDEPVAVELERHRLHVERAEVDPQRVIGLAEQRRDLVEQAGLRADPVVLDPRAHLGQVEPIELGNPTHAQQRQHQRDLERGRRGQAGAPRHGAADLERRRRASATPARPSSPAAPRTNPRQPSARSTRSSEKLSRLPRSTATASMRRSGKDAARTVTPSLIANGSARPWL